MSVDYQIKPTDTLESLFGRSEERNFNDLRDNPVFSEFQKKFKIIHNIGRSRNVSPGETLGMIVEVYGHYLDKIQFGKLDEVIYFVKDNIDTRYKILAPELHVYLTRIGYYEKSSTAVTPPEMMRGFVQTILGMMKQRQPLENFAKLGEEISKII